MVSNKLYYRIASQPLPIKFGSWLTIFLLTFAIVLAFLAVEPTSHSVNAQTSATATPAPTVTPQPTPTPTPTPPPSPTPVPEGDSGSRNSSGPTTLLIFVGIFIVGSILAVTASTLRVGRRRR